MREETGEVMEAGSPGAVWTAVRSWPIPRGKTGAMVGFRTQEGRDPISVFTRIPLAAVGESTVRAEAESRLAKRSGEMLVAALGRGPN